MILRQRVVELITLIQRLPYVWPGAPDAASARRAHAGTCASKHALLVEELDALGVSSVPLLILGTLVPQAFAMLPHFAPAVGLLEVHECLTVITPWVGPLRVDITWDPPLIERGLPGTMNWDGESDMPLAVDATGPGWGVPRAGLREYKEALRRRLYGPGERERRDAALKELSRLMITWRSTTARENP